MPALLLTQYSNSLFIVCYNAVECMYPAESQKRGVGILRRGSEAMDRHRRRLVFEALLPVLRHHNAKKRVPCEVAANVVEVPSRVGCTAIRANRQVSIVKQRVCTK